MVVLLVARPLKRYLTTHFNAKRVLLSLEGRGEDASKLCYTTRSFGTEGCGSWD